MEPPRAGTLQGDRDSWGSRLTSSGENFSTWVRRSCLNLGEEGVAEPGVSPCPHPGGRRIQGCPGGSLMPPAHSFLFTVLVPAGLKSLKALRMDSLGSVPGGEVLTGVQG